MSVLRTLMSLRSALVIPLVMSGLMSGAMVLLNGSPRTGFWGPWVRSWGLGCAIGLPVALVLAPLVTRRHVRLANAPADHELAREAAGISAAGRERNLEAAAIHINADENLTTLINVFSVPADRQAALVSSLRAFTEGSAHSLPGFIGAAVHASTDGSQVVNYVQWKSAEDLKRMLSSVEAQAHLAEVDVLANSINPRLHQVAYVKRCLIPAV